MQGRIEAAAMLRQNILFLLLLCPNLPAVDWKERPSGDHGLTGPNGMLPLSWFPFVHLREDEGTESQEKMPPADRYGNRRTQPLSG